LGGGEEMVRIEREEEGESVGKKGNVKKEK
jgi:hypothetical protein